jgi:hypothetical protein
MIGECEALATALSLHRALEVQARACRNRARRQGGRKGRKKSSKNTHCVEAPSRQDPASRTCNCQPPQSDQQEVGAGTLSPGLWPPRIPLIAFAVRGLLVSVAEV